MSMKTPFRVQRKRSKGWRMPDNTIYVGRGSRWGNPFVVGKDGTVDECIRKYADYLLPYAHKGKNSGLESFYISEANLTEIETTLRGKNLACWCSLDKRCHADLLLELANKHD